MPLCTYCGKEKEHDREFDEYYCYCEGYLCNRTVNKTCPRCKDIARFSKAKGFECGHPYYEEEKCPTCKIGTCNYRKSVGFYCNCSWWEFNDEENKMVRKGDCKYVGAFLKDGELIRS